MFIRLTALNEDNTKDLKLISWKNIASISKSGKSLYRCTITFMNSDSPLDVFESEEEILKKIQNSKLNNGGKP